MEEEKKLWGEKTLKKIGVDVDINTRLLLNEIKKSVTGYLEEENFIDRKPTPDTKFRAKEVISSYLETLKEKKAITDNYKVDSNYVYHGWKKLYPKFPTRILAFTVYLFQKNLHLFKNSNNFKWYHFVLPFEITDELDFLSEIMEEDWEDLGLPWSEKVNWIMGNARKYMFHSKLAKLLIPYYDLQVDI